MFTKKISDESILLSKIIFLLNKFNIKYISKDDISKLVDILNNDKKSFLLKDPSTQGN